VAIIRHPLWAAILVRQPDLGDRHFRDRHRRGGAVPRSAGGWGGHSRSHSLVLGGNAQHRDWCCGRHRVWWSHWAIIAASSPSSIRSTVV
jgi:hypothetical protein